MSGPRGENGFALLDEENAILDTSRLFERKGIGLDAGKVSMGRLIEKAKAFFVEIGGEVEDPAEKAITNLDRVSEMKEDKTKDDSEESDAEYEFVVSLAQRGAKASLHRRGGCWRARRMAFGSYEVL